MSTLRWFALALYASLVLVVIAPLVARLWVKDQAERLIRK